MNDILDEMGKKWQTLSRDQQVALAQNVAGTRQYAQLVALMDSWDDFQVNLITATNAEGTLQKQQEIYLDSLDAHLEKMNASWEGLYKTLFDEETIKFFVDGFTKIINLANTFVTGLGGGLNSIIYIAMTLGNVFSKQISNELVRIQKNAESAKLAMASIASAQNLAKDTSGLGSSEELRIEGEKEVLRRFEINQKLLNI